MKELFNNIYNQLNTPLSLRNRFIVFTAGVLLIPVLLVPLWKLNFISQQYPEGLELFIYPNTMTGGNDGNDLTEINVLNHYIGMAELHTENFKEFQWLPLVIGILCLITIRGALLGSVKSLVDILGFTVCFSIFGLWRFWYMLNSYGHNLDPKAAINVEPFTPPVFGLKMVGQFSVTSYPAIGALFFGLFFVLVGTVIILSLR